MQVVEAPKKKPSKRDEINNRFTRHRVKDEVGGQMDALWAKGKTLASWISKNTPEGREQSLALTHLEQAVFWANAGLARAPESTEEQQQPEKQEETTP